MKIDAALSMVLLCGIMILFGLFLFGEADGIKNDMFYSSTDAQLVLGYHVAGWICIIVPLVMFISLWFVLREKRMIGLVA